METRAFGWETAKKLAKSRVLREFFADEASFFAKISRILCVWDFCTLISKQSPETPVFPRKNPAFRENPQDFRSRSRVFEEFSKKSRGKNRWFRSFSSVRTYISVDFARNCEVFGEFSRISAFSVRNACFSWESREKI